MARPKEYEREQVIAAATELFWLKGYHGTSLTELVSATKLNKQSMYKEFGSKAGLFDACLEHYRATIGRKVAGLLSKEPHSVDNIRELFQAQIEFVDSKDFKGCMFVNSASELEYLESGAVEYIEQFFNRLEKLFAQCLKSEFSKSSTDTLALYFVHLFVAVLSVGKVKRDSRQRKKMVELALSVLDK